jgi:triosephosphate isomerase
MNLGPSQAHNYSKEMKAKVGNLSKTDVWVAPPTVSMSAAVCELTGTFIKVGAQNVHWAESGAFTGETSPAFLTELGISFALVGHSERRTYFGETDEHVAMRTQAGLKAGLDVIVCIGETEKQRVDGHTEQVLRTQLEPVLAVLQPEQSPKVIIAYEPVWAIGTGRVASSQEIADTHAFIHSVWNEHKLPSSAVILYGGSVNPTNFAEILALEGVDGALVGGASIKMDQWLELIAISEA